MTGVLSWTVVFISEWFPNPVGPDSAAEFVELYNGASAAVLLDGWRLETENGKKFSMRSRTIPAKGYLVLRKADTKLSLRNTDGSLSLYDAAGHVVDRANFFGAAPEGKSFSRVRFAAGAQSFAFVDPTPGAQNAKVDLALAARRYEPGIAINRNSLDIGDFFVIMMGTAVLLTGLVAYIVKTHEDLSELFFGRDKKNR